MVLYSFSEEENRMSIILYTKPQCVKCNATKKYLDKLNLPYQVKDVTVDPEAREFVESLGYKMMPVVQAGDETWNDFRIEKILALKQSA